MNNKTKMALENRKAILRAVAQAFRGNEEGLTKAELANACPNVNIDGNNIERLRIAGVIKSTTRGRHAKYIFCLDIFSLYDQLDTLAEKMHRGEGYKNCAERKVLTEKKDLKDAFRRAKAETAKLQEELDLIWKKAIQLERENNVLKEKLSAIKTILK